MAARATTTILGITIAIGIAVVSGSLSICKNAAVDPLIHRWLVSRRPQSEIGLWAHTYVFFSWRRFTHAIYGYNSMYKIK